MLDLEVVPERSLGNEQWEFTLGKCPPAASGGFTPPLSPSPAQSSTSRFSFG